MEGERGKPITNKYCRSNCSTSLMIKFISKYYLMFPPLARNAINVSIGGLFSFTGVDYNPTSENILLGADELTKKLFI